VKMGTFKYEDDLLKHFIRTDGWLPLCKQRRKKIRYKKTAKNLRDLRYFTFCAVGAIDVLMLDVHNILNPTDSGFETVVFFDKDRESVIETQTRIPGSVGFVGDFVKLVTSLDADDDPLQDDVQQVIGDEVEGDFLASPEAELDTAEVREEKRDREQLQRFVKRFPFDVINLDLEEYVFKPSERLPGKLLSALRKIFTWQQRPIWLSPTNQKAIEGFSLMFTTKIGPGNLPEDYLARLQDSLHRNLQRDDDLNGILQNRAGTSNVAELRQTNFELFFKLAIPKLLARTLMSHDWYIDPERGIKIYEFERPFEGGSYKMLHMAMDVKRHDPPRHQRLDGELSDIATEAYQNVVRRLFADAEIVVSEDVLDQEALTSSLDEIIERGNKYREGA
jgi:hypothetical protein